MAVGYTSLGERYHEFPRQQRVLYNCSPIYEELPGWGTDISAVRAYEDLPEPAQNYVAYISDTMGVAVRWVSVGPERQQLVTVP